MKWIDYREKLGIGMDDIEKEVIFRNKLSISLTNLIDYLFNDYSSEKLFKIIAHYNYIVGGAPFNNSKYIIINNLADAKGIKEKVCHYVAFANAFCKYFDDEKEQKAVWDILYRALDDLKIPYEIYKDIDGVFIFPKGAKELDGALVSEVLEWMKGYPNSQKVWIASLKSYSEHSEENASNCADMFRKALEAFFQEFFNSSKTLENLKVEYGDFLKNNNVPKEISGNFETLLQAYTNYINNYAKHRDNTNEKVLEYILYQTGNIIRLLITLEKGEN